jgi:hypothetical protein
MKLPAEAQKDGKGTESIQESTARSPDPIVIVLSAGVHPHELVRLPCPIPEQRKINGIAYAEPVATSV